MSSQFLHLEQEKEDLFINKLLINGFESSNTTDILDKIYSFYTTLYENNDSKSNIEFAPFLDEICSLPRIIQDTTAMTLPISERD